jgi:hypothetical protein
VADIPDNVTLGWIAQTLVAIRDDVRTLRADVDKLIVLTRQLHEESITQGAALVRLERRLDRLERERNPL